MKITKLKIKNLFGITETELDGRSVELSGGNGVGKTSVIDAIKYALTNSSERELIVKQGEKEGEILIEADSDFYLNRKKRTTKADYKSLKINGREASSPEALLKTFFTPLQLDPIKFTQMSKSDQNRIILDLIEFEWDYKWLIEQFGEVPSGIDYEQNILQVLHDIQSETSPYYLERQEINRDKRVKKAFIEEIEAGLPAMYDFTEWKDYPINKDYEELAEIRNKNSLIERAKAFADQKEEKLKAIENEKELKLSTAETTYQQVKSDIEKAITTLEAEIEKKRNEIKTAEAVKSETILKANSDMELAVAKLEKDMGKASEYCNLTPTDTGELEAKIKNAEEMKGYVSEAEKILSLELEVEQLEAKAELLNEKITKARELPGEILAKAKLPISDLTVVDGVPMIKGTPVSNLSEGEKLELCVDVAISKPSNLQIILIDGVEKLSDKNRERLYAKCKDKGLQFIATRTNNADELEVNYL